jgi:hypothetical protein
MVLSKEAGRRRVGDRPWWTKDTSVHLSTSLHARCDRGHRSGHSGALVADKLEERSRRPTVLAVVHGSWTHACR